MILLSMKTLRRAAANRPAGYLEDVLSYASSQTDSHITLTKSAYDRLAIKYRPPGPGTELKALLKTIGIVAKPNCSCNKRAKIMDEKGCDWCEEHIDEIDGWLAEEAKKRNLPYISLAGKTLIRLAIRRARKKGNSK